MFDTLTTPELNNLHSVIYQQIMTTLDVIVAIYARLTDSQASAYTPHWTPEGQIILDRASLLRARNREARETLRAIGDEIDRRDTEARANA